MTSALLINEELRSLIPPLHPSEYAGLEASILEEGVRDALIIWDGYIVDGHNRYDICTKHGITDYRVVDKKFTDIEAVKIWIKKNQISRRNIAPYLRGEYYLEVKEWEDRRAQAKLNVIAHGNTAPGRPATPFVNSQKLNTTKELAKAIDVGEQAASRIIQIHQKAPEEIKEKARTGEISINEAYTEIKRQEAKERLAEQKATLAAVKPPTGQYRTIVIDPPWPMEKIEREVRPNQHEFDYPTMTIEEIKGIKLPADISGCHVYLWTTQKYLPTAFEVFQSWGVNYQCLLTWVKNVGFTPFSWMYSTEHCLFGRIGNLQLSQLGRRLDFNAGVREHSRKPDEFYALIRDVSPEPRIDYFSRGPQIGFEQFGNDTDRFKG